jgi:hypothetical protein
MEASTRESSSACSTRASEHFAAPTIAPLVELGAVELDGRIVWSTGAWRPVVAHLTAVEVKLSKWRDALRQADNFARSADRSWVVLDEAHARAAVSDVGYFEALGIGLAILSATGRLRVGARPLGRRPIPWLRAQMGEHAWEVAESEVVAISRRELLERDPAIEETAVDGVSRRAG